MEYIILARFMGLLFVWGISRQTVDKAASLFIYLMCSEFKCLFFFVFFGSSISEICQCRVSIFEFRFSLAAAIGNNVRAIN